MSNISVSLFSKEHKEAEYVGECKEEGQKLCGKTRPVVGSHSVDRVESKRRKNWQSIVPGRETTAVKQHWTNLRAYQPVCDAFCQPPEKQEAPADLIFKCKQIYIVTKAPPAVTHSARDSGGFLCLSLNPHWIFSIIGGSMNATGKRSPAWRPGAPEIIVQYCKSVLPHALLIQIL